MEKSTVNLGNNTNPRNSQRRARSASQSFTAATGSNQGSGLTIQEHDALPQSAGAGGHAQHGEISHEQTFRTMDGIQENYPYLPPSQNFPPSYPPWLQPHTQPPQWFQQFLQYPFQNQYNNQQHGYQYLPASQFTCGVSPQQQLPHINTNPRSSASTSQPTGSASSSVSPSDSTDQTEERISIAEEKRRRNTSASARFRIKKKQRSLNLEMSLSDLTGRAEELEKEATELRRENGWLREIVMLKGSLGVARASGGSEYTRGGTDSQLEASGDEESSAASEKMSKAKGKGKE